MVSAQPPPVNAHSSGFVSACQASTTGKPAHPSQPSQELTPGDRRGCAALEVNAPQLVLGTIGPIVLIGLSTNECVIDASTMREVPLEN